MNYIELVLKIEPHNNEVVEILTARLSMLEYESFTETESGFNAYIQAKEFNENELKGILDQFPNEWGDIKYSFKEIEQQNWNAVWEKNFEPIIVADKCTIKAAFHKNVPELDYNILIAPKMAFGTGHHATTSMMLQHILDIDLEGKNVLDMGAGTGVLAILASMKNAKYIYAVDIDTWAYNNCVENIELNNCKNIEVFEGDVSAISDKFFDVILANINKNTLINDIEAYIKSLNKNGILIMSGFYVDDIPAVEQQANANDLFLKKYLEKDEWASVVFEEK